MAGATVACASLATVGHGPILSDRGRGDTIRAAMDRRLAHKNVRTGLIAGAISTIVFAAAFFAGYVY